MVTAWDFWPEASLCHQLAFRSPIKPPRKSDRPSLSARTCSHQRRPDVIVMAVTSQILRPAGALGEVLIGDWQGAGLPKASLIKPVLATIEQRLILRKL